MTLRPIEWEIRGVILVRDRPQDSHLGHGMGRTGNEAIADWKSKKLSQWARDAASVYATPAPTFRVARIVAAMTLLGSLLPAEQPAWGMLEGNTLVIHTPTPPALVREGAIFGPVAQWLEQSVYNGQVDGSTPSRTTIFTEETRDEAKQERNYGTTRPSLEPIDHGETCKTVYANHTQTECVTAGETAPILNIFTGQFRGVAPWEDTDAVNTKCANARRITASVECIIIDKCSVRAQTLNGQTVGPERPTPFLSTVDVGNTHTASEAPVRKPPGYPARVGGPSSEAKLADGGQSFRTILGALSVVTCGLAGLLVLACVAIGGGK